MKKHLLTLMVAMGFVLTSIAQQSISGKVTNASGAPIPNVSVVVKGTTVGTTTAADGTYSISVPASAKQLTFSSLSYESQDVTIGNRKTISVVLAEAGATEMTGVVVTG
ncbi:MAG: carboxypeptidase-like regulatory domain-containing protein, partial [Bacteroidetes bacterium]|nr:carboxypeptidase-like regulatory domain-containing protein [Bacteroidota bacterium]